MPGADEVLFEVAGLDRAEREAALDRLCGDDAELRSEVASLLAAHDALDADGFLLDAPLTLLGSGDGGAGEEEGADEDSWIGRRLGPYRIVARLGAGGMGAVYAAERDDDEFEKRVAIKRIRRGLAGAGLVERFRRERQILAALEHPYIARLLDGGTAEDGTPYLVMESVDGLPIDRWCAEAGADLELRLRLLRQACRAVQYAHQRLVVHRDLKPGNILVAGSVVDTAGEPEVKLLDFGIAKLLHEEPDDSPGNGGLGQAAGGTTTVSGHRVLTPAYASPEQLAARPVTTASDVYSLGVVLFQTLTGELPGTPGEPPRRLSEVARASELAGVPETLRKEWPSRLRGDLDAIVARALQQDPAERYATAEGLADDLDRHLAALPVSAREPTLAYRAQLLVRRRTAAVVASVALLLTLIASSIVSTRLFLRAETARAEAVREKAAAEEVADFLAEVLTASDPLAGELGADPTVRSVLDEAAPRIADELGERPEIAARLLLVVSRAYDGLSLLDEAAEHAARALELRSGGPTPPEGVVDALEQLASVRAQQGRTDEAFTLLDRAEELLVEADGEVRRFWRPRLDYLRATIHNDTGRPLEAEPFFRSALSSFEEGSREHLWALQGLGVALVRERRLGEAETLLRRTLELAPSVVGPDHPFLAQALNDLAWVKLRQERPQESLELLERSLEAYRSVFPSDHPKVAMALDNVGNALTRLDRPEEAIPYHEQALAAMISRFGSDHQHIATAQNNLANALVGAGRFEEASERFAAAAALYAKHLGDEHPWVAIALRLRSRAERRLGRDDAADELARRALAIRRTALPADHFDRATSLVEVAEIDLRRGDPVAARAKLREAVEGLPEGAGDEEDALRRRALELLASLDT